MHFLSPAAVTGTRSEEKYVLRCAWCTVDDFGFLHDLLTEGPYAYRPYAYFYLGDSEGSEIGLSPEWH